MTAFSRDQAAAYVRDFRPLECVGAYRIEDRAGLIERVEHLDGGGESGVMGLPATLFERLARRAGLWSLLS
jgi:predicted house-cleaning NTP pyrophosphatase (Maf/HAM1 superfamily)